ncbi:MAG TPA: alpha-L-arabinofuranosidase C-terminal domain-containing protein [Blastocatellia bacterium]|nr:alpha-L-arabinofuranosidase C-terminal domain-containing protein [Blastocatellia bacterium]
MQRRTFLKSAAYTGLGTGLGAWAASRRTPAADAEIELAPDRAGAVINPHIYGHFIEHLGGVIYDGIWVGRNSRIPNVDGMRRQFIDDMKRIGAPNLRWPGGCFADGYHWRDGIGPAARRPRTYNFWESRMPQGLHATETNQFGIHEFMRLCRLIGAEPYLAANVGSGTPREFHDWVSYCNAPAGTESLADERAANGDKEPFRVKYWGVGNESWGCGGDMKPGEYAVEYRKFVTQFPVYVTPFLVATGPRGHSRDMDLGWTDGFFAAMQGGHRSQVNGFSLHFYTDFRNNKMRVADFKAPDWYAVLLEGLRTEAIIEEHWKVMGKYDPQHRTRLVIDEWGVWYQPGEEITPGYILSQPVTLRDALHTAITFDIFNRHADKIEMANVAQTVNCIHSLFLALEDKYTRTPPYYVFEMYRPHLGARSVPMQIRADQLTVPVQDSTAKIAGLTGSASLREKRLTVTLTNASVDSPIIARIRLAGGARASEGRGTVLTHSDMRARNTFQNTNEVRPASLPVKISGETLAVDIPRQAVAAIEIQLA